MKIKHTTIISIIAAFFNLLIIIFPKEILSASKSGLILWFNTVLPSLLPFIICTELLFRLDFVRLLGSFLDPLMRKVFRIGGCGSFALISGLFSGYPIGAKVTCDLYSKDLISRADALRLLSFSNNSGPLFILGAVASGMLNNTSIGFLLLFIHYISAFLNGIVFSRIIKGKSHSSAAMPAVADNISFGSALSSSVSSSAETIISIGGYIILFSVIIKLSELLHLSDTSSVSSNFLLGTVEITNGCKNLSAFSDSPFVISMISALIAWGGFSIHAQTVSFISKTDLKISLYIFAKFIQAVVSFILCFFLYPVFIRLP
ncbi:MAG: hypothetical protein IJ583_13070 [Firmicutes bacterium]|nr:hypothetical protein [Bacillota bacterium]